ncbi:hypothetical protein BJV82DRAFT_615727, partial [Fennellomyces sp. T-0311]
MLFLLIFHKETSAYLNFYSTFVQLKVVLEHQLMHVCDPLIHVFLAISIFLIVIAYHL